MSETRTTTDRFDRRAFLQLLAMARRRAREARLGAKLAALLVALALASGAATIIALTRKDVPFEVTTGTIRVLLLLDLVFLLALAVLIAKPLSRLWVARRQGLAGSKLHGRIVRIFSLIAVGPSILMAIFTAVFFEFGIQSWFSETVRGTLQDSLVVAESYVREHRQVIQGDILAMAIDLNRQAPFVQQDRRLLQALVDDQTAKRALSEAIVFTGDGIVLARSTLNLELAPERVPEVVMEQLNQGNLVLVSETEDDRVRALVALENFVDAYLYVSRFVNSTVMNHAEAARASVREYESLEGERSQIQLRANFVFLVVAILILLIAVWVGLSLATQLVAPIAKLIEAAEQVGKGNLNVRVPALPRTDELGTLSRTFNRMTKQLSGQQEDLIKANRQLDARRRFTEAVLSGVSAAVIGLDKKGTINLPNRVACEFLGAEATELEGKRLDKLLPELADCFRELETGNTETVQRQIAVSRNGSPRMLSVRIARETGDRSAGSYVVTFDDITDQLSDQRTAAWADVARRIAHEIKNPLTPIQLSAERLKRKYRGEITTDPEVFEQCTDTIIRQVADLRRMVDEFSSFARMPEPLFRTEDIVDIVRQAVFLQEVGTPNIDFHLDLPDEMLSMVCDGRLIAQALTNVIKNSVESIASRRGGGLGAANDRGAIDITIVRHDTGKLEIAVSDNGAGLPTEIMERLTEPYVTTRAKGTGLGLAIVRKVVEDHHGHLTLQNRAAAGAKVTMQFDLAALERKLQPKTGQAKNRGRKKSANKTKRKVGHGA